MLNNVFRVYRYTAEAFSRASDCSELLACRLRGDQGMPV
jgi:hypothetical protein